MMMTSSKKAKSLNNSSLDYSLVGLAEIDIENDLLNSDSDESDFDDDLDKSVSQKVCKKRGKVKIKYKHYKLKKKALK